ncbi:unnamed protein product [Closterium sp. Yama58-4]|nr:unnamed protein product [Closterium sp. Yama58-4]
MSRRISGRHGFPRGVVSLSDVALEGRSGSLSPKKLPACGQAVPSLLATVGSSSSLGSSFLPPAKQYLITRNVPCLRRVGAMEEEVLLATGGSETLVDADVDGDGNDPWVATSKLSGASCATTQQESLPSIDAAATPAAGGGGEGGGAGAGGELLEEQRGEMKRRMYLT